MFKIETLKMDETTASNKLLGIKFNFDDKKKLAMEEVKVGVREVEQVLAKAKQQGLHSSDVVCHPMLFLLFNCNPETITQGLCGIRLLL
jgi:hypothetical protein